MAAREARLGAPSSGRATRWGLARTTTVIEDSGGLRGRLFGLLLDRRRWPAIPAVLLVTTLFTLALSGFRSNSTPATVVATASPGALATVVALAPTPTTMPPTAAPTANLVPEETLGAPPTTAPSPSAEPTPKPSPRPAATFRTYVVKPGDSLSAIAARYGVTVGAIANLNNISDPSRLSVGQVLRIPR
jgi:LysM repeat protein